MTITVRALVLLGCASVPPEKGHGPVNVLPIH